MIYSLLTNKNNITFSKSTHATKRYSTKEDTKKLLQNLASDTLLQKNDEFVSLTKLATINQNKLFNSEITKQVLDILSWYDFETVISELNRFGMCGNESGEIILRDVENGKATKAILSIFNRKTLEKETETIDINSLILLLEEFKNRCIKDKPTYEMRYEKLFQEFLSKMSF